VPYAHRTIPRNVRPSDHGAYRYCARDVDATVIIRGLRAVADFEYEFQMVGMNRSMDNSIETVFLMADAKNQAIASKLVKEIARLGGDVTKFVPGSVKSALHKKLGRT